MQLGQAHDVPVVSPPFSRAAKCGSQSLPTAYCLLGGPMHPATLQLLRAPDAPNGAPLSQIEIRSQRRGEIVTGTACAADGGCYPIADGILDLLPDSLPLSAAQRANLFRPTASFYEQVWRVRSLSLFTG